MSFHEKSRMRPRSLTFSASRVVKVLLVLSATTLSSRIQAHPQAEAASSADSASPYAEVRYPHEEINNWGRWGAEDQKGAANYITPETIVSAAKLIRTGRTFSLAIPLDHTGPVFPGRTNPLKTMSVSGTDYDTLDESIPESAVFTQFADDYIHMPLQGSTQWDALSHGWYGRELYNGLSRNMIRSSPWLGGATVLGIQNIKDSMVGRGILVDIVRFKGGSLPRGYGITRADIEGALQSQGTEVRPGDMVLLRTGVVPEWYKLSDRVDQARYWEAQAGILKDVIPWIKSTRIAGMAADNISLERNPHPEHPELGTPLHGNILRDLGVYIGEIWWLEELAADCTTDRRYEFFLAAQPLNIPGGVGSPLNPIAIK